MADSKLVDQDASFVADDEFAEYDAAMAKIKDPLLSAPPTLTVMHARFGVAPSTFGAPSDEDMAAAERGMANADGDGTKAFRDRLREFFRNGRR